MDFSVFIRPSAKKSIKKLPFKVKHQVVYFCAEEIAPNPYLHPKLKNPLHECRSFHFKVDNVHYRIAYVVLQEEKRIDVVLIGSRENFYDQLRRALGR